ncbi:neutral amino acid permease [Histoplasma ohiense]|nr:neutral amino acid permease [Histoplasma ohiense (nom. inval.)]
MEGVKYDGQDIEQMWREALVEFHKLSGHDPKKFSELSIGDVIGKINQQKELDDKKAAKYGKAKEVLNKTLTCIQTLGSLVAQGA